eukprot:1431103-Alexandrium_andersonii.AAC.1
MVRTSGRGFSVLTSRPSGPGEDPELPLPLDTSLHLHCHQRRPMGRGISRVKKCSPMVRSAGGDS